MGIGVSVFLLAVGAILAFAVDFQAEGIDINTVGVILMIVGSIGLLFSLFFLDSWGWGYSRRRTVVDDYDDDYEVRPRRRRVVRERDIA